jgi:hypothetical protein
MPATRSALPGCRRGASCFCIIRAFATAHPRFATRNRYALIPKRERCRPTPMALDLVTPVARIHSVGRTSRAQLVFPGGFLTAPGLTRRRPGRALQPAPSVKEMGPRAGFPIAPGRDPRQQAGGLGLPRGFLPPPRPARLGAHRKAAKCAGRVVGPFLRANRPLIATAAHRLQVRTVEIIPSQVVRKARKAPVLTAGLR